MTHPGLANGPIYLDYNATTPVDPRVVEASLPYFSTHFGNPSSAHAYAEPPRRAIAAARTEVAALLGCAPEEVVFTGGGSEADNLAIRGAALASHVRGAHIVTQETEHPGVLGVCRALERLHGVRVTHLPVDAFGRVSPADLEAAITPRTVLVSIMHATTKPARSSRSRTWRGSHGSVACCSTRMRLSPWARSGRTLTSWRSTS